MTPTWPSRQDYDTAPYWQGLAEKKLLIARCDDCGHWIHPPRGACPACWSDNITRQEVSGKATLFSYIFQPGATGVIAIAWAELIEQKRLLVVAELADVTPETIRIGANLSMEWTESRNLYLPVFRQEQ